MPDQDAPSYEFTVQDQPSSGISFSGSLGPEAITFSPGGRTVLVLRGDGSIDLGPGVEPSEAAAVFLEQLAVLWPEWVRRP